MTKIPRNTARGPAEWRFFQKVDKTPGQGPGGTCWVWAASINNRGYASIRVNRKKAQAHRFSWELHNGPIPDGLCVLHRCDNPPCVNPEHLFLGTKADNRRDMVRKDRAVTLHGERNGFAKLTTEKVLAILSRWPKVSQRKLAAESGVSPATIHYIVHRKNWRHVT